MARCSLVVSPPRERPARGRPARCRPRPVLRVGGPPFAGPGGVLMGTGDGGVDADLPGDQPLGVGLGLQPGQDPLPGAIALPAAKQPIHRLPGPVAGGHIPPRRPGAGSPADPINQLAFAPVGGRPALLPLGSSGSSLAHCSLVRSPRPMPGASHATRQLLKHALGAGAVGPTVGSRSPAPWPARPGPWPASVGRPAGVGRRSRPWPHRLAADSRTGPRSAAAQRPLGRRVPPGP